MFVGCSGSSAGGTEPNVTVDAGTVVVGSIPDRLTIMTQPPPPPSAPPESLDLGDDPIASHARNNRILLIGDQVLEGLNQSDLACTTLNAQGWTVEVDAVGKATVAFGSEVLTARLNSGDFGVVGVLLGNNLDGDLAAFTKEYNDLIDQVGGRPVLVFTPNYNPDLVPFSEVIRNVARERPNVRTVEWGYLTASEPDESLTPEGTPSTSGANSLWNLTNEALGTYGTEGDDGDADSSVDCLPPAFTSANYTGSNILL